MSAYQRRHQVVLALALLVTAVGAVESVIGDDWDQLVILATVAGLLSALLAAPRTGRRPADLRPDLAVWLHEYASATGEPPHRLLDRCVAAYRAGLSGSRRTTSTAVHDRE